MALEAKSTRGRLIEEMLERMQGPNGNEADYTEAGALILSEHADADSASAAFSALLNQKIAGPMPPSRTRSGSTRSRRTSRR
jgi:hypothetical protein